jgi:hypothetical protein
MIYAVFTLVFWIRNNKKNDSEVNGKDVKNQICFQFSCEYNFALPLSFRDVLVFSRPSV